ncbi:unnamed protein product [Phytomonas sp. Hart1]|nr:unnamed protein product [Phytomonas sp. Hart1]|eukprot:CCW70904.1 unnamed protein product [Phytomonas sp. isolate Hart1]
MDSERKSLPYDDLNRPFTTSGTFAVEWRERSEAILESITEDEDVEMESFSTRSENENPNVVQSVQMILGVPNRKTWEEKSLGAGTLDGDRECYEVNPYEEWCKPDGVFSDVDLKNCENKVVDEKKTTTQGDSTNCVLVVPEVNKDTTTTTLVSSEAPMSLDPPQSENEHPSREINKADVQDDDKDNIDQKEGEKREEKTAEEVNAHCDVKNDVVIAQKAEQAPARDSCLSSAHLSVDKTEEFQPPGVLAANPTKVENEEESRSPILSPVETAAQQSLRRLRKTLLSPFPREFRTIDHDTAEGKAVPKDTPTPPAARRQKEQAPSMEPLLRLLHGLCEYSTFLHGGEKRRRDEVLTPPAQSHDKNNGDGRPHGRKGGGKRRASAGVVSFGRRRRARLTDSLAQGAKGENDEVIPAEESRQAAGLPPCGFSFKRWNLSKATALVKEPHTSSGVSKGDMEKTLGLLNDGEIPVEAFMSGEEQEKYARYAMSSGKLRHECVEPFQFLFSTSQKLRLELQEQLNNLGKGQGMG